MSFFEDIARKVRGWFLSRGYTCDGCGVEIFDYPKHRLCENCEEAMSLNDKRVCEKCGRETVAEGICLSCKSRLPRFTKGFSPFVYRGESASLVNRLKNGNPVLSVYFGERIAEYFLERVEKEPFLIIPVPLTKLRERERGYNQAEALARAVCLKMQEQGVSCECRTDILQKNKDTAPQKKMGYGKRMENVAGAYHVHKRKDCRGCTVLLIDDIMTTGATGSECAARLLSAGAEKVYFLTAVALAEQR